MNFFKVDEIKTLIKELNRASERYYIDNNPIMSDHEFDKKFDRLKKLEEDTGLILSSSPTQNVGFDTISGGLDKVSHSIPLLSLDKTKEMSVIERFAKRNDTFISLKLDGLTMELIYEGGKLIQASTRGNGEIGEDITHNAKVFKNIPLTISYKDRIKLVGEALIHKDDFDAMNQKLPSNEKYKTPRNLASGSVRQLDNSIAKDRFLYFYCFNVLEGLEDEVSKTVRLSIASKLGFTVVPYTSVMVRNSDLIESIMNNLKDIAIEKNLPIDGLVIAYDDVDFSNSLGKTSRHRNDGIAFKEEDEKEETVLRGIEWTPTRVGNISPVAIFDTVVLDGTEVSRASLSNISIIEGLDLLIGDRILVSKRNQIIPYVEDNLDRYCGEGTNSPNRSVLVSRQIPSLCPCCNQDTIIEQAKDSKVLKCSNDMCKTKLVSRIQYYASRDCMNIEGLSEATITKLIDLGLLNKFRDIYSLKDNKDKVLSIEGFGDKSFNRLVNNIQKSRDVKLENFISAIGIPNVGRSSSKIIAEHCNHSIDNLLGLLTERFRFSKLKDFGAKTNKSIYDWFDDIDNDMEFRKIASKLNFIVEQRSDIKCDYFKDKTIVITGTMESLKRKDIKKMIEDMGGLVRGSVSKNTDIVIYGSNAGSKLDRGRELQIELMTESEFIDKVKQ